MGHPIELSNRDLPALRNQVIAATVRGASNAASNQPETESNSTEALTETQIARMHFDREVHNRLWSVDAEGELDTLLSEFTKQAAIKERLDLGDRGMLTNDLLRFLEIEP